MMGKRRQWSFVGFIVLLLLSMVLLAGCNENESFKDSDGDDLFDWKEYEIGTDPYDKDSDDDGINDGGEVQKRNTDPLNPDSDGDGQWDGDEVAQGTDPLDPESYYVPDEDLLQPYGKRNYNVTKSTGTYIDKTITITYELKDEQGFWPSTNKSGCIMLVDFPEDYEPGIDDLSYYTNFDDSGKATYTRSTDIVPGIYIYEFCGIYKYEGGEYIDLIEYVGDGDEVTVEVEPIPIVKVVNTSVEQVGENHYECRWYFSFIDGSSGVIKHLGEFNKAYTLHYINPEYDGYWGSVGFYDGDYIKVLVGPVQHDWVTVEIEWIDDTEIGYDGDGDAITIYR